MRNQTRPKVGCKVVPLSKAFRRVQSQKMVVSYSVHRVVNGRMSRIGFLVQVDAPGTCGIDAFIRKVLKKGVGDSSGSEKWATYALPARVHYRECESNSYNAVASKHHGRLVSDEDFDAAPSYVVGKPCQWFYCEQCGSPDL